MDVKKFSGNQPLKFEKSGDESADGKTNVRLKKLVRRFANPREAFEKVKETRGQDKNPVRNIAAPVVQRRSPPKPLPQIPAAKPLNTHSKSERQESKFQAAQSVFQAVKPADMMDYIAQCAAFKKLPAGKIQNLVMEINSLTAAQSVTVEQINAFRTLSTASGPRQKWNAGKKALAVEFANVWLSLSVDKNGNRLSNRGSN